MTGTIQKRFLQACQGAPMERPPVWFMRQAGRYLPEYQAVRGKVSFLELCKNPDLATEVSMQPLRRFGMDAVIFFCDILVPPEAMGMNLTFTDKGPEFLDRLMSPSDINRLVNPDVEASMGFVGETLRRLRKELDTNYPGVALLGFAGSPWTLACYMIEGGTSKQYLSVKQWLFEDAKSLHALLEKLTHTIIDYLHMQVDAGVDAVQLFDTWAGLLTPGQYETVALPYQKMIIESLQARVPVTVYVHQSRGMLSQLKKTGANIISVDWYTPIAEARTFYGPTQVLQGNLDPAVLFCKPTIVKSMVLDILENGGSSHFIFNLGHGILPQTPIENVKLVVDTVKQWSIKPLAKA